MGPPLRANSGLAFGAAGHRNFLQRLARVPPVNTELPLGSAIGSASHFVAGSATPKATVQATPLEDELDTVQHGAVQKIQPARFALASLN